MGIFGAIFLTLCYPVISMLWRFQYPLLSMDVFLLFTLIALGSVFLALLVRGTSPWVGNLIVATCIIVVFVLQFDMLWEDLRLWVPVIFGLALVGGRYYAQLALAIVIAMLIGSFADTRLDRSSDLGLGTTVPAGESKPMVLHILLDEFIGPDGLPPQQISQQLRTDMLAFFRDYDFEVYNKAYSHYHATQDSLSHTFQLSNGASSSAQLAEIFHQDLSIAQNRYFELMHEWGYSINVYQTDMMDFCSAVPEAINRCRAYTTPNLASVATSVQNPWLRIRAMLPVLFKQSKLFRKYQKEYRWMESWNVSHYQPAVIDEMLVDMQESPGRMYFAHLLLPHSPYVYQADCRLDYDSEPWERIPIFNSEEPNSVDTRAVRYIRYLSQVRCALSELQRLFDGMRRQGIYDQATIIVHGDHGSRISLNDAIADNEDTLTPEDYRDLFSTLYAIRMPAGEARTHQEVVSLTVLLARTLARIGNQQGAKLTGATTAEETPFIYLSRQIPLLRQDIDIFQVP